MVMPYTGAHMGPIPQPPIPPGATAEKVDDIIALRHLMVNIQKAKDGDAPAEFQAQLQQEYDTRLARFSEGKTPVEVVAALTGA